MQNGRQTIILDFISAKYVISYPCVESLDLVSYTWSRYFALADIAGHINFAKLKVNLMETFSLKHATCNKHFFVSGHSN